MLTIRGILFNDFIKTGNVKIELTIYNDGLKLSKKDTTDLLKTLIKEIVPKELYK